MVLVERVLEQAAARVEGQEVWVPVLQALELVTRGSALWG